MSKVSPLPPTNIPLLLLKVHSQLAQRQPSVCIAHPVRSQPAASACEYSHHVNVLMLVRQSCWFDIDVGAPYAQSHLCVDGKGRVNDCGATGEVDNLAIP